jgi:hypothetical protein
MSKTWKRYDFVINVSGYGKNEEDAGDDAIANVEEDGIPYGHMKLLSAEDDGEEEPECEW